MHSSPLPNYLRTHRKRLGLSQRDVAFLLKSKDGARICRCERSRQTPHLKTLLAYEILFQTPIRDLYAGVRCEVEEGIMERAQLLLEQVLRKTRGKRIARKIATLQVLLSRRAVPESAS
jgi:DNA-binding XRE family transcriptional regulator